MIHFQSEPFLGMDGNEVMAFVRNNPTFRHELPTWIHSGVVATVRRCWDADPAARPLCPDAAAELLAYYVANDVGGAAGDVYM